MDARMKLASVIVLGLMVMSARVVEMSEAAISCGTVASAMSPCISYLEGKATAPPGGCCSGVKSLYSATTASRPDRITACNCLKNQASALGSSLNTGNAAGLAGKCGINLGYPITTGTNCNSIP